MRNKIFMCPYCTAWESVLKHLFFNLFLYSCLFFFLCCSSTCAILNCISTLRTYNSEQHVVECCRIWKTTKLAWIWEENCNAKVHSTDDVKFIALVLRGKIHIFPFSISFIFSHSCVGEIWENYTEILFIG